MFGIKNVEYILINYRDIIIFKTLHIKASFRGHIKLMCSYHHESLGRTKFSVISASYPDLNLCNLYLNGNDRYCDKTIVSYNLKPLRDSGLDNDIVCKIYRTLLDYINSLERPCHEYEVDMSSDFKIY